METPVNARYSLLILLYIVICFGVFWGIGLSMAVSTIRLGTPENKLKGYFILAAMILFILGAVLDALILYTDLLLLIPRFILIASALCFYLGFVTPNFLKKRISKQ